MKKKATENITTTLTGKKVLFIENDNGLYHGLDQIEELFTKHNIKHKCLFNASEVPLDDIIKEIQGCDAIVFQTQWVYDVSKKISEYLYASKDKKIIIECYISEPTWYYKPKAVHDVYVCKPPLRQFKHDEVNENDWKFYKLSQKPYWDYKNGFNK